MISSAELGDDNFEFLIDKYRSDGIPNSLLADTEIDN